MSRRSISVVMMLGCMLRGLMADGFVFAQQQAGPARLAALLSKQSLEVCLNASDADETTRFFAEGIGLLARGEPRGGAAGSAMRMF